MMDNVIRLTSLDISANSAAHKNARINKMGDLLHEYLGEGYSYSDAVYLVEIKAARDILELETPNIIQFKKSN